MVQSKALLFCDFHFYHKSHFSWKFHWNSSSCSEVKILFFNINNFHQIFEKIIEQLKRLTFEIKPLKMLLNNYMKLDWYKISFWDIKWRRGSVSHWACYPFQKKAPSKIPALLGLILFYFTVTETEILSVINWLGHENVYLKILVLYSLDV